MRYGIPKVSLVFGAVGCAFLTLFPFAARSAEETSGKGAGEPKTVKSGGDAGSKGASDETPAREVEAGSEESTKLPRGYYCVVQRVSVPIPGGVRGIPEGTVVQKLLEDKETGMWKVTNADIVFSVHPSNLTNDKAIAYEIGAAERQKQVAMYERMKAASDRANQVELERRKRHSENVATSGVGGRKGLTGGSKLDQ